jgi:adenylate kinase
MQVIILGPPGVGKGTQSQLIAQKLHLIHLSTGEILRHAVDQKTPMGLQAKNIMEHGKLVSDEIMIGMIREELSKEEMSQGFILDGFPRTLEQAKALCSILTDLKYDDVKIINLVVNEDEIVKRLMSRGRQDDSAETVKHRLSVYREQTAPVKAYYEHKFIVFDVNGMGSVEEINDNILRVLTRVNIKELN